MQARKVPDSQLISQQEHCSNSVVQAAPVAFSVKMNQETFDLKPLHPHSTSMPSTCTDNVISHRDFVPCVQGRIPNILLIMFSVSNTDYLLALVRESIANVREQFFQGQNTVHLDALFSHIRDTSHQRLLVVFFALLNIDRKMKSKIFTTDEARNQRKIARFLIDLRQDAVAKFFATERMLPSEFVSLCEELYVIA